MDVLRAGQVCVGKLARADLPEYYTIARKHTKAMKSSFRESNVPDLTVVRF